MSNPMIESMLANRLREGFTHPGDPDKDIPPTPILLPFKRSPGMPEEMGELMDGTVKLLTECIVAEIESVAEIVPRNEARAMRRALGDSPDGPALVPISCRCSPGEPLAILTVTDPDHIVVDGRIFLRGLAQRSPACPHEFVEYDAVTDLVETITATIEGLSRKDVTKRARLLINRAIEEFRGVDQS